MTPGRSFARFAWPLLVAACAAPAHAQEWHEAYREGVRALAAGNASRAVSMLEYAASQRPRPGRNVVTYGTNMEREYYPYLKLAEAYLHMRDLGGARSALQRSERWGLEPAEERRRLAARIEELAARLATPPPATPPARAPVPEAEARPPAAATPVPSPGPERGTPTPAPAPSRAAVVAAPALRPPDTTAPRQPPSAHAVAVPSPVPASVEVVSQPPGASVYLDDELIGTTDPEWGRLVRTDVPPGRHRIRLSLPGHADLTEEIDLAPGRLTAFRRRLASSAAPADRRALLFGVVALLLLALTAWALRRPAAAVPAPVPPIGAPAARSPSTPPRPTPTGMGSPGVHRTADGIEYFGDYRLVEPLGRGGMASVFKAERRGELSALKRPLPAFLDDPEFRERFLREAEIGRTLHHPNIVRILERGEVEGVPYFTMELLPGGTLQAKLQSGGALEPDLAARTVVQIAEALDYAHLKGVVHRDLKPSNVMVLPDGTTKVMDYGIARARRFEGLTVTGSFLGSPEYVAPETIEGKGADARSDLYSLGVIFYETLTGRRPFQADTPFGILRQHLSDVPPAPTTLRPGVPPELERIVLRLMSKEPGQRYAAAEDLVLELRDYLNRAS